MRREPGPLLGWPALFGRLGRELAELLPRAPAIVLERVHHLAGPQPTLRLLGAHLLPALPRDATVILLAHQPLPPNALPAGAIEHDPGVLRLDSRAAQALATDAGVDMPAGILRRALAL